ncbi:hypothetical protein [Streptomyces sp. NPDC056061]|uniref:hypothetical protein n=1 Tax=Streptomyces sp. NPDC056061 TaxID=3345700 RepID=UPI0035DCE244
MATGDDETGDTFGQGTESAPGSPLPEGAETAWGERAVPQTRRRLTGVELEARFDDWRTRREARTPEDGARVLRRGLGALMGTGIAALVITSALTGNSFATARAGNDVRITALEKQVAEAEAESGETDAAERMAKLSDAAAAAAGEVAVAQHAYAKLHHDSSMQPDTGNGAPNEAMLATAEHRRDLAPHFSKSSYLAGDEDAYTWQNVLPFDADSEIDPRFAWYVRYDGGKASAPDTYTWEVGAVTPDLDSGQALRTGTTDRARAVWLCRDTKTGDVLAWADANYIYDGTKGVFDDLAVVVTAAGAVHQHPSRRTQDTPWAPEISDLGTGKQNENGGEDR